MPSPVRVIVVGAGNRGSSYSMFAVIHPELMKVVAVADPSKFAREKLKKQHQIPDENIYEDWSSIIKREKFADSVFICTPDSLHKDPAVAFAKKGYHILLEKPMAAKAEECKEIMKACTDCGVMLAVCHVLRYDRLMHKIKVLIDDGAVGDLIHIQHLEPIGFDHFSHSYVRGNWRNEAKSSFALLAKSCHDIDLIYHWASPRRCVKVSSFGSVSHVQKPGKPAGAASHCLDCSVEEACPYSACKIYLAKVEKPTGAADPKFYLDKEKQDNPYWPASLICSKDPPDIESVTEVLKTGNYGRCVYDCDNDVCTNQVVNMEFEGGLTASFTMVGFAENTRKRKTTIYGSKGELRYDGQEIHVFDFLTKATTKHTAPSFPYPYLRGHGGGDYYVVDAFISAVANNDPFLIRSVAEEALQSHLLVFEAERSRREARVVFCGDTKQS